MQASLIGSDASVMTNMKRRKQSTSPQAHTYEYIRGLQIVTGFGLLYKCQCRTQIQYVIEIRLVVLYISVMGTYRDALKCRLYMHSVCPLCVSWQDQSSSNKF